MEWSLHIGRVGDLHDDLSLDWFASASDAVRQVAAAFGNVRFDRCAFGSEFCEHRIPGVDALREAFVAARSRGLNFTLLTPYVSDAGMGKLRPLFACLTELGGAEVSFSDWGVLNVLRREFPSLTPVQSRLLNKSLRDPRVMSMYGESQGASGAVAATLAALQRSNLDCTSYHGLLARFGIRQIYCRRVRGSIFRRALRFRFIFLSGSSPPAGLAWPRDCITANRRNSSQERRAGANARHICSSTRIQIRPSTTGIRSSG
jgi:hypothetical protein